MLGGIGAETEVGVVARPSKLAQFLLSIISSLFDLESASANCSPKIYQSGMPLTFKLLKIIFSPALVLALNRLELGTFQIDDM